MYAGIASAGPAILIQVRDTSQTLRFEGALLYVVYLSGAFAHWCAFPIAQATALSMPRISLQLSSLGRATLLASAAVLVYSCTTGLIAHVTHTLLSAALGVALMDQGLSAEILVNARSDIFLFGFWLAFLLLLRVWEEQHAAALRAAELETKLVESRLHALASRLEPHFLFNALNTVSSLMHEDLPRTERLIGHLGELLRAALSHGEPTWSLDQEAEYTSRFVDFIDARFGDRISVSWHLPADLAGVPVPRFTLQLLVENAVKHNQAERGRLAIRIEAARRSGRVLLTVSDDGRGFPVTGVSAGRGLFRLGETLRLLHGDRSRLSWGSGERRGARVEVELPEPALR